jgi:hypothetical protein
LKELISRIIAAFLQMRQAGRIKSSRSCYPLNGTTPLKPISLSGAKMNSMNSLPGNDLISAGIRDLESHRETIPALLVAIGAPKLRSLGLDIPSDLPANPEHRLYELLSATESDSAHSKYNALIRKLVSFERALPCVNR